MRERHTELVTRAATVAVGDGTGSYSSGPPRLEIETARTLRREPAELLEHGGARFHSTPQPLSALGSQPRIASRHPIHETSGTFWPNLKIWLSKSQTRI
jgi:hypothetical protein